MAKASAMDDLVKKFGDFCEVSDLVKKDRTKMTSKACGKLVKDTLVPHYGKYEVDKMVDASVFPTVKSGPAMAVNDANVKKFVHKTAHELAKKIKKDPKLPETDPEVAKVEEHVKECIRSSAPMIKEVKQSKTGNVGGLTDASKYTGAHKERFDKDGKGKGAEGRVDKADDSGYVGNYKGSGTYDKKK